MKPSRRIGLILSFIILPVSVRAEQCPGPGPSSLVDQLDNAVGTSVSELALAYEPKELAKKFESQGLVCEPFHSELGLQCQGIVKNSNYPEPVLIIVPANYKPKDQADLIWHFHGYTPWITDAKGNSRTGTFEDIRKMSQYAESLAKSGRDGIMIVPSSKGSVDTYKDHLLSEEGFESLFNGITATVVGSGLAKKAEPKSLTLTSHSAGYRVLTKVMTFHKFKDRIGEFQFFDSLYHSTPEFIEFAQQHPKTKIVSVFNQNSGTEDGAFEVWLQLNPDVRATLGNGLNFNTKEGFKARQAFYADLDAGLATNGCLQKMPSICFIRTKVDHNSVVPGFFPQTMKSAPAKAL